MVSSCLRETLAVRACVCACWTQLSTRPHLLVSLGPVPAPPYLTDKLGAVSDALGLPAEKGASGFLGTHLPPAAGLGGRAGGALRARGPPAPGRWGEGLQRAGQVGVVSTPPSGLPATPGLHPELHLVAQLVADCRQAALLHAHPPDPHLTSSYSRCPDPLGSPWLVLFLGLIQGSYEWERRVQVASPTSPGGWVPAVGGGVLA